MQYDDMPFRENERVWIETANTKTIGVVTYKAYSNDQTAFLSPNLKDVCTDQSIKLSKMPQYTLNRFLNAKVDQVKYDSIEISREIVDGISQHKRPDELLIVNNLNGFSLKLPLNNRHFYISERSTGIRLSIKHRRLLDVELPTYINQPYIDKHPELKKYYHDEQTNITYDNYYKASNWFKSYLKTNEVDLLTVYPIYHDDKVGIIKRLQNVFIDTKRKALEFLIGQKSINLRTIRPYPIDESENTVRLSTTVMQLLGLEETDNVVIKNGNKDIKARVLCMDDLTTVQNENRIKDEREVAFLIGIPTYMRKELDLTYINSNVTVERDLSYFFRKNLNNQIISIIGVIVSMSLLNDLDLYLKIILNIVLALIFIYFSFSDIREKISNK